MNIKNITVAEGELKTHTPDQIILSTLGYFKLDYPQVVTPSREREVAYPRMLCMFFLRRHARMKLKNIAILFNRDRSTVNHGIETINGLLKNDYQVQADVKEITALIIT